MGEKFKKRPSILTRVDFLCAQRTEKREKAIFVSYTPRISVDIKWAENADFVTIMPVVSADGHVWNSLVILLGKWSKRRVSEDGRLKTTADYLPQNFYQPYRNPAGIDSRIFQEWVNRFFEETKTLRRKHKCLVLTLDGYGAHIGLTSLKLLRDNNITTGGLPAHASHRTQILYYSVFTPFKTILGNALSERNFVTEIVTSRYDVYTVCETLHLS